MRLISGGAYQGKLRYALERTGINDSEATDGKECSLQELLEKPLVNHFHLWIDRMLKEEQDIYTLVDQILAINPEIVIIVDELGCGIVPMDAYDRRYRELTGRICCKLAKEAEEVHRVICGIGTVIKHA
jgi:adenosyl cobinamide kinase/adenosyl cobinamide phosphate guanylyltransferase